MICQACGQDFNAHGLGGNCTTPMTQTAKDKLAAQLAKRAEKK